MPTLTNSGKESNCSCTCHPKLQEHLWLTCGCLELGLYKGGSPRRMTPGCPQWETQGGEAPVGHCWNHGWWLFSAWSLSFSSAPLLHLNFFFLPHIYIKKKKILISDFGINTLIWTETSFAIWIMMTWSPSYSMQGVQLFLENVPWLSEGAEAACWRSDWAGWNCGGKREGAWELSVEQLPLPSLLRFSGANFLSKPSLQKCSCWSPLADDYFLACLRQMGTSLEIRVVGEE